jgi:hypothetical protein
MPARSPSRFSEADPDPSSPLSQLAEILAHGVLRLYTPSPADLLPKVSPQTALNSASQDLAKSAETRLTVTNGLRSESPEPRRHQ